MLIENINYALLLMATPEVPEEVDEDEDDDVEEVDEDEDDDVEDEEDDESSNLLS